MFTAYRAATALVDTAPAEHQYLTAARNAIKAGKDGLILHMECPECGQVPAGGDFDPHATVTTTSGFEVVVIGCEGYWVVNPAALGVGHLAPNWEA